MKNKSILFGIILSLVSSIYAQEPVQVGAGSYAEYTPLYKCRTDEHAGDQSRMMETRTLYITDAAQNLPIPTNDWWTDLIVTQYSGNLWSYPQVVNAEEYGFFVAYPKEWTADGREMNWNTHLEILGKRFHPISAAANNWHDWGLNFLMKDEEKEMSVTLAHGIPFTWVETKNLSLQLRCDNAILYNDASTEITLPYTGSQLVVQIGNDAYGIYAPNGTLFEAKNGLIDITFSGSQQFISIGVLPSKEDLVAFSSYAYVIPRNTTVSWDYNETSGKMTSHWNLTTENLKGDAQLNTLQGFIPHHYKNSTLDFGFTPYEYATPRGKMKMAVGNSFSIAYDFNGILPYFAAPKEDLSLQNPYQKARMKQIISDYADKGGFGADTYWGGKGLTQMALYMTFAHEMGETELFEKCKSRLKNALVNWLTFTPGENEFFFARYNRWKGLVGYNTSYDSDTFNDHHFHYGYFTYAASLLALFDEDFKQQYGGMATLLAKDYANWDKTDTSFPFFRTLDPWAGHSYAGGMAGWGGNGQESTSEAMQGWGGMYLLGVATNNKAMRDAGIFGWVLESRGTAEYWFDRDHENIDYTKYDKPYSSNLTSQGVGWWTWFSGDPVWMHSIQWMPISPCLKYLYEKPSFAEWDYTQMWNYKEVGDWSTDPNIASSLSKESGIGNVVLSYLQIFNPDSAASVFDRMWDANMPIVKNTDTGGISYFVTHSHRNYGDICWDIHADIPTATTYKNPLTGIYTYVMYNPDSEEKTITFYQNGTPIKQIKAPGNKLTVFSETPVATTLKITRPQSNVIEPNQNLQLNAVLLDQYGATIAGTITWSVNQGGSISATGLFTAGTNKENVTVTAQSGLLTDTLSIKIDDKPILTSAQIFPQQAYLEIGKTLTYSLHMLDQYGESYNKKVDWEIFKNGELVKSDSIFNLSTIGLYTVEATVEGQTYTTQVFLAPKFSNIALNKTAHSSSEENGGTLTVNVNDGVTGTRWASQASDPQWVYIDLNAVSYVAYVSMVWENAYASLYEIQISDDGVNWTSIETKNGLGGTEYIEVNKYTQYVRMYGTQRATNYGYSLYEFEVYGVEPLGAQPVLFGIDMQPRSGQLKEGESVNLIVTGYDQYGDTIIVNPVFSILSGTGTITPEGIFTPTKYGTATVQATVDGKTAKVSFIIEESLKLASVSISPKAVTLIVGTSKTFAVDARDQFGAPYNPSEMLYTLLGAGGSVTGSTFTSNNTVGSNQLIVGSGEIKDTANIQVAELNAANLALQKPIVGSSYENDAFWPIYANDGDINTRWSSAFSDPQYLLIDLADDFIIDTVKLFWDSFSTSYRIDVSLDEDNWTTIYTQNHGDGGNEVLTFPETAARFVRFWSLERATVYGSSLWEIEVYGSKYYANPQAVDIDINPNPVVASLGEDFQITGLLYDQYGLLFNPQENFTWSVNGGGSIDANGKFTPTEIGEFILTAQYQGLTEQFPLRVLTEKTLSKIEITPSYSVIEANKEIQLSFKAFDQYGNEMSITPDWNTTGGTVTTNGLFSSNTNGSFTVTASLNTVSATCQIDVITANTTNIALNKPTTSSSGTGSFGVDGNLGTRWESAFQDGPEWLVVDLNDAYQLTGGEIVWEGASARNYEIQISKDGNEWTTLQTMNGLTGARTDTLNISGIGRYVRIWCTKRSTVFGYSIWEFRLYGSLMQTGQAYTIQFSNPKTELNVGKQNQYTAIVLDKNGIEVTNPILNWSVSGLGYISDSGLFSSYYNGATTINVSSQMATTSLVVNISMPTEIKQTQDDDIKIWTNNQIVFIKGNELEKISIYNINGKLLISSECNNTQYEKINMNKKQGIFIISVQSKKRSFIKKIIL